MLDKDDKIFYRSKTSWEFHLQNPIQIQGHFSALSMYDRHFRERDMCLGFPESKMYSLAVLWDGFGMWFFRK